MAVQRILFSITRAANVDLSDYQYHAVYLTSDKVAAADTSNEGWGILQNAPDTAGNEAEVGMLGLSKAVSDGSGAAISAGDRLNSDASGHLVKEATDGETFMAVAMEDSDSSGQVISVFLMPFNQVSDGS